MLVANMNQVARSQRIFSNFGGYDVGPLLCHFRAMLGHLELCWGLSGVKFQPQPKHGSVEVEFCLGFGLMLGHLEAMLGYVGLFGALLAAFGPKFQSQRKHGPVEVEFGVGFGLMLGHLEAMLGLCWAFVGPFGGYVWPLLGHFRALLAAFGPKFQSQRKHGPVQVEFGVGFGLLLGHLEAMLGFCCAIFQAMLEPNLATRFGFATRMQKNLLVGR